MRRNLPKIDTGIYFKCFLAIILLFLSRFVASQNCTPPSAPELVYSGDFENGLGNAVSGYIRNSNVSKEGRYQLGTNAGALKSDFVGLGHGGSGQFMIVNGAKSSGVVVWQTTINNIVPGTNYYFSAWVLTLDLSSVQNGLSQLQFSINGVPLGPVFIAPDMFGIWEQNYQKWFSGTNTSATISIINLNSSAGGNDFGLDDISFRASCEGLAGSGPAPNLGPDLSFCNSAIALPLNSGIADPTGLKFLWSTGETTPSINVNKAGQYIVCVDSAGLGCYKTDTVNISASPTVSPAVHDTFACEQAPYIQLGGGNTGLVWYDHETSGTGSVTAPLVSTANPGQSFYYVSKQEGACESTRSKITAEIYPAPIGHALQKYSVCSGKAVEVGEDSLPGFQYHWLTTSGIENQNASKTNLALTNNSNSAFDSLYILQVRETQHSCKTTDSVLVTVQPVPTVAIQQVPDLCVGAPDVLLSAAPGGGTFTGTSVKNNAQFSPGDTGVFSITYAFAAPSGCKDSSTIQVKVHPLPKVDLPQPQAVCIGSAPIVLNANPAGGIFSGSGISGNTFNPAAAGDFWVKYVFTSAYGCKDSASANVKVFATPAVSVVHVAPMCIHAIQVHLEGNPSGGVFTGQHISNGIFTPEEAGSFQVSYIYSDSNSCKDTASVTIVVKPEQVLPVNLVQDKKICKGDSIVLDAGAGTTFLWTPGGSAGQVLHVTPKTSSFYKVTVRDMQNCGYGTDSVFVQVFLPPSHPLDTHQRVYCFNQGSLVLNAPAADGYLWQPGNESTRSIEINAPGIYWLTLSTGGVCFVKDSVVVKQVCSPTVYVPQAFSPNGDGANDALKIFGEYYKNFNLKIYDRWGEIIFETSDAEIAWDGLYKGSPVLSGVYPWVVHYEGLADGVGHKEDGSVVVVR